MADRPTMSTFRVDRPRMRSRSAYVPSHLPIASKTRKLRTASAQRTPTKGKSTSKGKKATKKSNKAVAVVSSDSENLEVDFPHYHPNQPHEVPTELPQQPNPPVDSPTEEQQEPDHPTDDPIEEPHHPANIPAEDVEQPQNPGNPNPLPAQPPIPMANNQLNWSHFRPEFSWTPNGDAETHLLRTEEWMTIHDFPEDQKVGRFCLTFTGEARLWYATLNIPQQQLNWDSLQERFRQQYSKSGNT